MGTLLDLLLIFLVLIALLDGFRQGALRAALRLVATLVALIFAAIVLRVAIAIGFAREGWGLFLVYMLMFAFGTGLLDGLAGALHRRLRPPTPADPDSEPEPTLATSVVSAHPLVYIATARPDQIAGLLISGFLAALTNGVFVLLLRVLPVEWIAAALGGSATAPVFVELVRAISFLLPPEIRP